MHAAHGAWRVLEVVPHDACEEERTQPFDEQLHGQRRHVHEGDDEHHHPTQACAHAGEDGDQEQAEDSLHGSPTGLAASASKARRPRRR